MDSDESSLENPPPVKGGTSGNSGFIARLGSVPPEVWIFIFYAAVTVALTWPLITHLATSIYGKPGDNLGAIWLNWWYRNAAAFGGKASFSPMIGFPFGTSLSFPVEPLTYLWMRFLLLFTNQVVAWNIDIMLSFLLSGVTMYYLVRYLARDRRIAFFGGFVYLIGVFHAYYAMWIGAGLSATQWMPLYVLMLLKFIKKANLRSAALLALTGVLVASTSIHFGFFMGIFTVSFLIGRFAASRIIAARKARSAKGLRTRQPVNRQTLALSLGVLLVVILCVLPFFMVFVLKFNPAGRWPTSTTPEELRAPEYTYYNAASPGEYLVPNVQNPLFGSLAEKAAGKIQPSFGNAIYVGWTIILLTIACIFLWRSPKKRRDGLLDPDRYPGESQDTTVALWGFALAGAVAFVFSLKPYFTIGSVKIPLPSKLFTYFAPWFRWYSRLAIVVSICLIVIACFGLKRLMERVGSLKPLVVVAALLLVTAEMIMLPPVTNFDFAKIPSVFKVIQKTDKKAAYAFYPLLESGPFVTQQLMFYQTEFQRPMLNGGIANSDAEAMRRTVFNPYDPATPGILRRLGIDYMVFFTGPVEGAGGQDQDPRLLPPGFQEVSRFKGRGTFENGRMYKVTAPPANIVPLYLGDISIPYIDVGAETTRLLDHNGIIKLLNYSGRERKVDLSIPLTNPFSKRDVTVEKPDGTVLWRGSLGQGQKETAVIKGLDVGPRGVDLLIRVNGQSYLLPYSDLTIFGVNRASLQIGDVTIIDGP
jgi:hypothetical protein